MNRADPPTTQPTRKKPPLATLVPAMTASGLYATTAITWVVLGDVLPGGRWLAVHLFTVGVVSNMIVALAHHFAQTLVHAPARSVPLGRFVLLNVGAILLLAGLPGGLRWVFATGAFAMTAAVLWLYRDLRRLRKSALGARFAFVVRGYERACGAFVHGALLGGLLGTGLLSGAWHGAGRLAHLHLNVLGWAGLTLLATVAFFGPTVMRTRIEEGADTAAASALRCAAGGLTVAAVALLLTGAGDVVALPARLVAAAALAVYAAGATVISAAVLRAGRRAQPSPHASFLRIACGWFVAAAWLDVAIVAAGQTRFLDAIGTALLLGVLTQALLGSLGYLTPMVRGVGSVERTALRSRLEVLPLGRPLMFNVGVGLIVGTAAVGTAGGVAGAITLRIGWLLVASTVLGQLLLMAAPARGRSAPR